MNQNAWNTKEDIKEYLNALFKTEEFISNNQDEMLLMIDGFSGNDIRDELYKSYNIGQMFLPANSTHLTQPLCFNY